MSAILIGMKHVWNLSLRGALLASTVLLAASVQAADHDVEVLLGNMRTAYQRLTSVTFKTESHIRDTTYLNSFSYLNPNKMKVVISFGGRVGSKASVTIMTDGKTHLLEAAEYHDV